METELRFVPFALYVCRRSRDREIVSLASFYTEYVYVVCELFATALSLLARSYTLTLYFFVIIHRIVVKEQSQHTIGVEFSSRTLKIGEKRIKLQVSCSQLGSLACGITD